MGARERAAALRWVLAAAAIVLLLGTGLWSPAFARTLRADTPSRWFPETGFTSAGSFLAYWENHGALAVFGYPITGVYMEDGLLVQYYERARFELHPENEGTPHEVLLTRLGYQLTATRDFPAADPLPGATFFAETQHNVTGDFLAYWQGHGGLGVFGYPVSEGLVEMNPADGHDYWVQYFERARFELHPENNEANRVLLGHLGQQTLALRTKASTFVQVLDRQLVRGSDLQPLKLKGFNYFPRDFAWVDMDHWPIERVGHELDQARSLGANVIRVFISEQAFGGLASHWSKQASFSNLVQMARARGLYLIVSLFDGYRKAPEAGWDKWPTAGSFEEKQDFDYLYAVVGSWKNEPDILAWDLYNEPDHVNELEWQWNAHYENRIGWLQRMAAEVRKLDGNHLVTVGVALASSNWSGSGGNPTLLSLVDFVSVHYYRQNYKYQGPEEVVGDLKSRTHKPILFEEAGLSTMSGPPSESDQANLVRDVLHAASATNTSGVLVWTLYDFPTHADSYEGYFGLMRKDESLKPAAQVFAKGK